MAARKTNSSKSQGENTTEVKEAPEKKKFKVISAFRDKNTKNVYVATDDYECDEKRAKELKGFIKEVN